MNQTPTPLLITQEDYERLNNLIDSWTSSDLSPLENELERATLVSQKEIPPDVVTMNSAFRYLDIEAEKESEARLVYPHEANGAEGRISIFAPIGMALIGLRAGSMIDWSLPSGKTKRIKVLTVTYQPEREGHWNR